MNFLLECRQFHTQVNSINTLLLYKQIQRHLQNTLNMRSTVFLRTTFYPAAGPQSLMTNSDVHILPYVTHLFNTVMTTSQYPIEWRYAKIIPVPKSGGNEYRPFAILSFLSKQIQAQLCYSTNKCRRRNNVKYR